jgi:DNA-directed RNA polymerase subunit omega
MELQDSNNFSLEMNQMTIETSFDSNYRKVLVAARRARQIQSGSAALVPSRSTKACRIAQDEIDAGKISYVKKEGPIVKPLVEDRGIPILAS